MVRFWTAVLAGLLLFAGSTPTKSADIPAADDEPLPPGAIARLGTTRFRPTREAQGVSFLPNGRTLVQMTSRGYLEYWDAESGRFLRDIRISEHWIHKAAHTPDGRFVAIRGSYIDEEQRKSIQRVGLFEVETGREQMQVEFDQRRGEQLAISADGSTIAFEGEKLAIIDTASQAEVLNRAFADRIWSLCLSPDGQTVAIGSEGKVLVWKWAAGEEPREISIGNNPRDRASLMSVLFSPDGGKLAIGVDGRGGDGVLLVDVESGKEIRRFNVEGVRFWYPRTLAFSRAGSLLAAPLERNSGGGPGGAAVWNVETGELIHRLEAQHESVSHIAFSLDRKLLGGVSYWDAQMCVWNLESGKRNGGDLPGHADSPAALRFLPDENKLVTAGDDGTIRFWDVNKAREDHVLQHELDSKGQTRWIRAMDASPNGKYIATSSLDDTVRIWEVDTGREMYRLPGHGRMGGRRAVRFTPDSLRLVSWGDDMRVYIWDVDTGKAINEYRASPTGVKLPAESETGRDPFGRGEGVFQLDGGMLSPDASRLLAIGRDAHVFDIATGMEIAKFERTVGVNTGLAISPDNQYVLALAWGRGREIPLVGGGAAFTAAKNHLVELRKLSNGELVADTKLPEGGAGAASFSHDGRQAAITIGDDEPRVLILSVPELKEVARVSGMRGRPRAVEFSRSGKRLAVSNADTSVVVYDLEKLHGSKPMDEKGGEP